MKAKARKKVRPVEILLYECAPLSARITERQCGINRQRARRRGVLRNPDDVGARMLLRPHCLQCPGVVKLNRGRPCNSILTEQPRRPSTPGALGLEPKRMKVLQGHYLPRNARRATPEKVR